MEILPGPIKILTPFLLLQNTGKVKGLKRCSRTLLTHSQTDLMRSSGQTAAGDTEQLSQSSSSGSSQHAPTCLWVIMAAALFRPVNSAFPHFQLLLCPADLRRDALADEGRHRNRGLRAEGTRGEGGRKRSPHTRERGRANLHRFSLRFYDLRREKPDDLRFFAGGWKAHATACTCKLSDSTVTLWMMMFNLRSLCSARRQNHQIYIKHVLIE